jgi:hypothetical protein
MPIHLDEYQPTPAVSHISCDLPGLDDLYFAPGLYIIEDNTAKGKSILSQTITDVMNTSQRNSSVKLYINESGAQHMPYEDFVATFVGQLGQPNESGKRAWTEGTLYKGGAGLNWGDKLSRGKTKLFVVDSITKFMVDIGTIGFEFRTYASRGGSETGPAMGGGLTAPHINFIYYLNLMLERHGITMIAVLNTSIWKLKGFEGMMQGMIGLDIENRSIKIRDRISRQWRPVTFTTAQLNNAAQKLGYSPRTDVAATSAGPALRTTPMRNSAY